MRELLVVLVVILVLLGLTAYKYRRHISMLIGFTRMIRDARAGMRSVSDSRFQGQPKQVNAEPHELVSCQRCGTWVPQDRAIRFNPKTFYCSQDCVKRSMANA